MKRQGILLAAIFLAGCATTPSLGSKSALLKVGMSKEEVTSLLGMPRTTAVHKSADDSVAETWNYWNKTMIGFTVFDDPNMAGAGNRLSVTFENDKVKSWGDQYDWANMTTQMNESMANAMKNMPPVKVEQHVYEHDDKKK